MELDQTFDRTILSNFLRCSVRLLNFALVESFQKQKSNYRSDERITSFRQTPVKQAPVSAPNKQDVEPSSHTILVDVTGVLTQSADRTVTNRYMERILVNQALADPDPDVICIRLNHETDRFEVVTEPDLESIHVRPNGDGELSESEIIWQDAKIAAAQIPDLGHDFDRDIALRLLAAWDSSNKLRPRQSTTNRVLYNYYKTRTRLLRLTEQASAAQRLSKEPNPTDGILLASLHMLSDRNQAKYRQLTNKLCFVAPEHYSHEHSKHSPNWHDFNLHISVLKQLRDEGALALCCSESTSRRMVDFDSSNGTLGMPAATFPMPSVLFEKAKDLGEVKGFEASQPFVLYSSTIEVRKNHILLARVWNRALKVGLKLPKLVCVGQWGWKTDDLVRYLNDNPWLEQHIEFREDVNDIQLINLYRSAQFCVYPSFHEVSGWGASEALDFGIPVIISTNEALQEATRYLMPTLDPTDVDAWLKEIHNLATNPFKHDLLCKKIDEHYERSSAWNAWNAVKSAMREAVANSALVHQNSTSPNAAELQRLDALPTIDYLRRSA